MLPVPSVNIYFVPPVGQALCWCSLPFLDGGAWDGAAVVSWGRRGTIGIMATKQLVTGVAGSWLFQAGAAAEAQGASGTGMDWIIF